MKWHDDLPEDGTPKVRAYNIPPHEDASNCSQAEKELYYFLSPWLQRNIKKPIDLSNVMVAMTREVARVIWVSSMILSDHGKYRPVRQTYEEGLRLLVNGVMEIFNEMLDNQKKKGEKKDAASQS